MTEFLYIGKMANWNSPRASDANEWEVPDLSEVVLRLARSDERLEWDRLMDEQQYLGFKQLAGWGLRYVAEWRGWG